MKPIDAARRVRETLAAGGDARTTAWACATQFDTDTLHHIAASWLVQSARNSLRTGARQTERESVPAPARPRTRRVVRTAEQQSEMDAITAQHSANLLESLRRSTERFTRELRAEWTADLLETGFVLPDGTATTWGEATVEQHEARAQMFTESAATSIEAAARHQKAAAELRASGAHSLRELVAAA